MNSAFDQTNLDRDRPAGGGGGNGGGRAGRGPVVRRSAGGLERARRRRRARGAGAQPSADAGDRAHRSRFGGQRSRPHPGARGAAAGRGRQRRRRGPVLDLVLRAQPPPPDERRGDRHGAGGRRASHAAHDHEGQGPRRRVRLPGQGRGGAKVHAEVRRRRPPRHGERRRDDRQPHLPRRGLQRSRARCRSIWTPPI